MKKVKESNAAIKIILLTIFVILFIAVYFIDSVFFGRRCNKLRKIQLYRQINTFRNACGCFCCPVLCDVQ